MRTGPGRNYPGTWLYQRRDLPVRVLKLYPNWRLIEDPDGTQGWMLVTLAQRPAHRDRQAGRTAPDPCRPSGRRARRAISPNRALSAASTSASDGWCQIEIGKREGYIRTTDIWGVGANEVVRLDEAGETADEKYSQSHSQSESLIDGEHRRRRRRARAPRSNISASRRSTGSACPFRAPCASATSSISPARSAWSPTASRPKD